MIPFSSSTTSTTTITKFCNDQKRRIHYHHHRHHQRSLLSSLFPYFIKLKKIILLYSVYSESNNIFIQIKWFNLWKKCLFNDLHFFPHIVLAKQLTVTAKSLDCNDLYKATLCAITESIGLIEDKNITNQIWW